MRPLQSLHIVAGLAPRFGGPSYSVPRLCRALRDLGAEARCLSVQSKDDPQSSDAFDQRFTPTFATIPWASDLRLSTKLHCALDQAASAADIIHNHGLWLAPNLYAGWTAARRGRPLVVSPRGMLSREALNFSALKKRASWMLLQGPALRQTACFHATSSAEYADLRRFGITAPIAIVPNGLDLPPSRPPEPPHGPRTVLYLGRIHPKKGLDRLLSAWAMTRDPAWRLQIVGEDEQGYGDQLHAMARRLNLENVAFDGPLYDEAKFEAFARADLFVQPTLNENFGLTIGEALASGTPVISTKGAPWPGLESHRCGWWIDHGADALAGALKAAMALPPPMLAEMGARGRAWMERDYSWGAVARSMESVYRWLVRGSQPPDVVALN